MRNAYVRAVGMPRARIDDGSRFLAWPMIFLVAYSGHAIADDAPPAPATPPAVSTPEFYPEPTLNEKKILAELERPTMLDVHQVPLRAAVDYLRDLHRQIEIQIDERALHDAGIDPGAAFSARVKDVSLKNGLRRLLDGHGLTAIPYDEVLLITTQERASSLLVVRTYPVHDLVENNYSQLIQTMTNTISPLSWEDGGGEGRIEPYVASRSLVIAQTADVHDQVLQLLRALRAARVATGGDKNPAVQQPGHPAAAAVQRGSGMF